MAEYTTMDTGDISFDAVKNILHEWVDLAYRIQSAGLGGIGEETAQQKAIDEMRYLHLSQPWLPANAILKALILAGWTPPVDHPNGSTT